MSVLDHPLISERYFFPRPHALQKPTWVEVSGARLACYSSSNDHPLVVLHFHGNGEVCADYLPDLPKMFDELGADCFLAEYRGYGSSTGTAQLGAMLDDVDAIFEAVGRPPEEVVVFGRSVGSIYAIELASRVPVAGLILESGIADPGSRVLMRATPEELGTTEEALEAEFQARLNHQAKLAERELPTLIMHAQGDVLVTADHAVRLASYPASNTRLVLFDRGDHNTIFMRNRVAYIEAVRGLLDLCREGESYPDEPRDRNDTLRGGIAVFEKTQEFDTPPRPPRTGPGETAPMDVPDILRRREGSGDTLEGHKQDADE